MNDRVDEMARRLSGLSVENYKNPYVHVVWPETLPDEDWYFREDLISIVDQPEYQALSVAQRKRLSFYEQVNFFSLNVHGERELMKQAIDRLYRHDLQGPVSEYLHHFIEEESHHSFWFAKYCLKYAGKLYPAHSLPTVPDPDQATDDFLFFMRTVAFEDIVDFYNSEQAACDKLEPTTRFINALHHEDESRHLSFGKVFMREIWDANEAKWGPEKKAQLIKYTEDYLQFVTALYYNPKVYRDVGIQGALDLRNRVMASSPAKALADRATARFRRFLEKAGIAEVQYV